MELKLNLMTPKIMEELKEASISMWDTNIPMSTIKSSCIHAQEAVAVLDSKGVITKY